MPRIQLFHEAIINVCDERVRAVGDADFYYDTYVPALACFDEGARDIAYRAWITDLDIRETQEWTPTCVEDAVKKGVRLGYALAQLVLEGERG
jgi:hypothetical protein